MSSKHVRAAPELRKLVDRLIEFAYPELRRHDFFVRWKSISAFAQISWSITDRTMRIECDKSVRDWHESQKLGLLAHELSHPATAGYLNKEEDIDLDVIDRGLGTYLAIERISAGKHEDHWLNRKRDRYLGYRSIRSLLERHELSQLDRLLKGQQLIPSLRTNPQEPMSHDISVASSSGDTYVQLEGITFTLDEADIEGEFKLVIRDGTAFLYVNDVVAAESELPD
ncbi:MAG: hypothetical protein JSW61_09560 [Candidatus Thorarchaeota archaeon]|nr:MAG: hypothetical protein JSW61_09560 [Candidatus Thorarchaeota archaeon]